MLIGFISFMMLFSCSNQKRTGLNNPASVIGLKEYKLVDKTAVSYCSFYRTKYKSSDCEEKNLSGITFRPKQKADDHDLLVVVGNRPASIGLLDLDGNVTDFRLFADYTKACDMDKNGGHTLECIRDSEGITYINGSEFVIVEERKNALTKIKLSIKNKTIESIEYLESVKLKGDDLAAKKNSGPEGIAYLPESRELLVVKEKKPKRIWKIGSDLKLVPPSLECVGPNFLSDWAGVSSIQADNKNSHWLLISSTWGSKYIAEIDDQCRVVEKLELTGLDTHANKTECSEEVDEVRSENDIDCIPNPEGVIFVNQVPSTGSKGAAIYVLSEPNFLYRLEK